MLKVGLRGQERRGADALVAGRGHVGKPARKQRPANAIAKRVRLRLPRNLQHRVRRLEHAFAHVVFEGFGGEALVRVHPGDDENGKALIHEPFDEGLRRREVQDVVFVDPRRHDQQRDFVNRPGRRRILDQLHDAVLINDLARRNRQVLADLERRHIRLADAQQLAGAMHIVQKLRQPLGEVMPARREGRADHLGVGEGKVRGRQGAHDLVQVKLRAVLGVRIDRRGVLDHLLGPSAAQQISLPQEIEKGVLRPFAVQEARIAGRVLDHRLDLLAKKALIGAPPQLDQILVQLGLRRLELLRLGHPILRNRREQLGRIGKATHNRERAVALLLILNHLAHDLAAKLEGAQNVRGKLLGRFETRQRHGRNGANGISWLFG